ncbi:hypothetical protein AB0L53_54735 [Nonomuraea sp. NPDC052129]|uniref:hypothetical protein n=1 Tax=Nonomuraea sp. NPDC052129 TaxID=3154651 RepID=UPI00341974EE
MPHDPEVHGTFGAYMRGGAPLGQGRTTDVITVEPTWATRDQVTEWRSEDGSRFKRVTDQAGHETTQETTLDGREKQHVRINLR